MKKDYRIPTIKMVHLSDDICLGVGSQNADPNQPAGAKGYRGVWGDEVLFYDEEDE